MSISRKATMAAIVIALAAPTVALAHTNPTTTPHNRHNGRLGRHSRLVWIYLDEADTDGQPMHVDRRTLTNVDCLIKASATCTATLAGYNKRVFVTKRDFVTA